MSDNQIFKANGKLLISGEYLVLRGATALAIPLRFGQQMALERIDEPLLDWHSADSQGEWFHARIAFAELEAQESDQSVQAKLLRLLAAARKLNPAFLTETHGYIVNMTANYPLSWGLGSSSTLIYLVARWAGVDPFHLFNLVSSGSGYDIACAGSRKALFFTNEGQAYRFTEAGIGKALQEYAYFAWLGKKQDSATEVSRFLQSGSVDHSVLEQVSQLGFEISKSEQYELLLALLREHDSLISAAINREPLSYRFSDIPLYAKSLGAWGGDFALFVSDLGREEVKRLLEPRGVGPVFTYPEILAE